MLMPSLSCLKGLTDGQQVCSQEASLCKADQLSHALNVIELFFALIKSAS